MPLLQLTAQSAVAPKEEQIATMQLSPCLLSTMAAFGTASGLYANCKHVAKMSVPSCFVCSSFPPPNVSEMRRCYSYARFGRAGTIWASVSLRFETNDNMNADNLSFLGGVFDWGKARQASSEAYVARENSAPRIAVIGGGIAGVTAAKAIATRLRNQAGAKKTADIVIYEGDTKGGNNNGGDMVFDIQRQIQPEWMAATAKNANCLVPGVAMHIMSQRHTLIEIVVDTMNEWLMLHVENIKRLTSTHGVPNIDNFELTPPYFALHMIKCLGPSAAWDERLSFITFLRHFVITSLLTGEDHADDRGKHNLQLAKANREAFLRDLKDPRNAQDKNGMSLDKKIGLNTGFMSLHRSLGKAEHAAKEAVDHGEKADVLTWEEAIELEPRIKNLPFGPLYAVQRLNDNTANCATYIRDLIGRLDALGIRYIQNGPGAVTDIERLPSEWPRFRVTAADGSAQEYDYLILAAGENTPLLARKVGAGHCCPTYPLQGYSLTLYTDPKTEEEMKGLAESGKSSNLLNRPISIDNIYCSSVGPNMARLAGFGELAGYADKARDVESVGPRVLARYARTIFPDGKVTDEQALQCSRPLSPDDLPLVGEVSCVPGLFLHTGHGTMGWTLSLATAECVAQAVCDRIRGDVPGETFELPDSTLMDRNLLSPDRFAWSLFDKQKWEHIRKERAL